MSSIIQHLCLYNQYLLKIIFQLLIFIAKHIPLKQYNFDDSNSPDYQKFQTDKLPVIKKFEKQDYNFLLEYYLWKYSKKLTPVNRKNGKTIPENTFCPRCGATHHYLYDNNGGKGEFLCKVCGQTFVNGKKAISNILLTCPYCGNILVPKKDRKNFTIHKCVNKNCSFYLKNLTKLPENISKSERHKYKLHYLYREFNFDFFKMDLDTIPDRAFSFAFRKESAHIMGLCLTYLVNLRLSLRQTAWALKDIHGISISHTMIANYAKTAAVVIKPFIDNFDYEKSDTFIADETYIKIRKVKGYVWFIMDAVSRSILGYRVSDNRGVGACIIAMRMAFKGITELPKNFKFIADGYSAYPLAAQQFALRDDNPLKFSITQVIGLSNDDAVSKEFRPQKQIIERLNRTFKASYRNTCGYDGFSGADYSVALWVAYYNFLRPHSKNGRYGNVLNHVKELDSASNMSAKWQILLFLGQQTILKLQENH